MLSKSASNLLVYGAAHASVDAACAGLVFSLLQTQSISHVMFFYLAVLYNLVAFGLQPIFGLLSDQLRAPRSFALVGCLIVMGAIIIFPGSKPWAIILAGLGNAIFHIGGGSISLNLTPRRASSPGIFVAPGAFGLFIGTMIGKSGQFAGLSFLVILSFICVMICSIKTHSIDYKKLDTKGNSDIIELILLLLLMSIAVRSFVGLAQVFPWKSDFSWAVILTLAVVLGKGLGGILADRWGWIEISMVALLISSPLISLGASIPCLAVIGMFLFNLTMPVTLTAISNVFPGRPGFSFGLTCFALIIGAIPTFIGLNNLFVKSWPFLVVIWISAGILYYGLRLYYQVPGNS